jgi:hypothetical protein
MDQGPDMDLEAADPQRATVPIGWGQEEEVLQAMRVW